MADNRSSYRLITRESPARERYDALLTTLQKLGFEVEPEGRDVYLTPLPEGRQLLSAHRAEVDATLLSYDDIIMEYPNL